MGKPQSAVEIETARLLSWFHDRALTNAGRISPFTNAELIETLRGGALKDHARAHGNVQSRIDFACYKCALPPLGLTAYEPFARAWARQGRSWAFPTAQMQKAAQEHLWNQEEFDRISKAATVVPLAATDAWTRELDLPANPVKNWAESFPNTADQPVESSRRQSRIDWTRDELILALDQYLRQEGRDIGERHPEIVALSDLLNRLGAVLGIRGSVKFRNPNGVAMKLMNFRRHDPNYQRAGKAGLSGGNRLEAPIWQEFASHPEKLAEVVQAIRFTVDSYGDRSDLAGDDESDITEAPEGKVLTRLHRSRERNRKLVEQAKKNALKKWHRLFCAGCDFEFAQVYGIESAHIIDCHHTKPVSMLAMDGGKTHVNDLILVCANCHRVIHSRRPWLTLTELKERIENAQAR